MAKSTKSSKASGFDVNKYIADMQEQSRKEKEARQKREALIQEYSIQWNMKDEEPPLPGMKLNAWRCRWEPENIDEFIREHGECINKFKNSCINNLDTRYATGTSESSPNEVSSTSTIGVSVQPEHQCTDATDAPTPSSQTAINDESLAATTAPMTKVPDSDMVDAVMSKSPTSTVGESEDKVSVEQSKKTRVSAKMVDAEFEELCREYLQVVSLGEKKPVFLPLELRDALDAIARLSGDRRLSASHVAINIIRSFINEHRELINRKLAGVKLSI